MKPLMLFILAVQLVFACPMASALKTSDGVTLKFTQTGPLLGQNVLFIPGWRQSAAEWRKQVVFFARAGYRVTTYDMRGHGESDEPEFGYRVSRFAADLKDVLTQLNLQRVTIVSHSMGCSVTWAFWDQYPEYRRMIKKLVLVDQVAQVAIDPTWSSNQTAALGAIFEPNGVYATAADIEAQLEPLVKSMFTANVSDEDVAWVISQNKKMGDAHAGALLINHSFMDWRDVLPRITVPTFVIGGEVSIFPAAGTRWVAEQIPSAKSYIFSAAEQGSHFMFWQNPDKFNSLVKDFIAGS